MVPLLSVVSFLVVVNARSAGNRTGDQQSVDLRS